MRNSHPLFARLAAGLALAAAVSALVTVAVAFLAASPKLSAWADVPSPFTGHVVIGGLGALLALKRPRYAWVVLAGSLVMALLVHAAQHARLQTAQPWPTQTDTDTPGLRVYTHNVWDKHPDLQQLETALEAVHADVLVLIEVDPTKQALLQRLSKRYRYSVSCAGDPRCANAILSRFPIVAGGADRAGHEIPPVAWARINASARGLGVITIIGTHIHRPTRNPLLHARQMQALIAMTRSVPGPLIVAGDLNAGPWSASYQRLLNETRLRAAGPLLPTWPMTPLAMPQFALDHILLSPDLEAKSIGTAPAGGSDHAPVFAEITARPRPTEPERRTSIALNAPP